MSPLGQQIARLLAPEHWDEWTACTYTIQHQPTDLSLWVSDLGAGYFDTYPKSCAFGFWEKRKLHRMARRVQKHLHLIAQERRARAILETLMTEEERAIEELLR